MSESKKRMGKSVEPVRRDANGNRESEAEAMSVIYRDGTEDDPTPTHCAFCRRLLVTKWRGVVQFRMGIGPIAFAGPVHVCESCGVAIRVMRLPRRKLYSTRKAARESVRGELASWPRRKR